MFVVLWSLIRPGRSLLYNRFGQWVVVCGSDFVDFVVVVEFLIRLEFYLVKSPTDGVKLFDLHYLSLLLLLRLWWLWCCIVVFHRAEC